MADHGKLKPYLDHVYTPDKTTEAIKYVLKRHPQGKVVIKMDF